MKTTSCWKKDVPCKLPFKLLQKATNNFSEERKLGHGAFGQVYKGVLEDGEEIAVKNLTVMPQIDSQHFENEFGHLKRLRHENIVRLLGFCDESEPIIVQNGGRQVLCEVIHRALCLEYMPNGSLTKLLSEEYTGNWSVRYRIIKGICQGVTYLHEELEVPILHLDLKPDNILLDQGMVPKIADFGSSRLFGEENTIITMSRLCTLGYCPPEFIDRGIISKEYDIFSLGVIIMKIIVGLEGYSSIADTDARGCFDYVYNNSRLNYAFVEPDYKRVRCCIEIAINCLDKDRRKRPRISDVVSKLDEMDFFSSLQQHPAAKEAEGSTVAIHSQDELVVRDFPATWCSMPRTAKFTNETVLSESDQFYSASQAIRSGKTTMAAPGRGPAIGLHRQQLLLDFVAMLGAITLALAYLGSSISLSSINAKRLVLAVNFWFIGMMGLLLLAAAAVKRRGGTWQLLASRRRHFAIRWVVQQKGSIMVIQILIQLLCTANCLNLRRLYDV